MTYGYSMLADIFALPPGAVAWQIAFVLGLLIVAVVLFSMEKLSVDIITISILILLVLTGILRPDQAYKGFGSDAVMSLVAIFVISGALTATGVLDLVGGRIMKMGGGSEARVIFMLMLTACGVSAFMNNTTVTAMFAPATVVLARRTGINPSKILMPLAFASILGGTLTMIGTSTNIAVNGAMKNKFGDTGGFNFFEVTPAGLAICITGIAYMMFIGRKQLVARADTDVAADYGIREYLSEIIIMPGSPLIGQRSFESDLSILDFRILKVIRGAESLIPNSQVILEESDILLVEGKVENLMKVKRIEGIEIRAEAKHGDLALKGTNFRIAEMLVTLQSEVAGRTLREADFRAKYGLTVLAIYRHGQSLIESIGEVPLRTGDVLLVQGPDESVAGIREKFGLTVLDEVKPTLYHPKRGLITVAIFLIAIIASSIPCIYNGKEWVEIPTSIAFLIAALCTVFTRAITVEKAYEFIDWKLVVLIGGMTAFGQAMEATKAADFLANVVLGLTGGLGPWYVMAGFFILTVVLTQPMSNAAAALVVLPVALKAAEQMGANQHSFAMAIMLAASVSFITPFEPSCLLVYAPGKYRFRDFVKVGFGLTVALTVVMLILIPKLWPLSK